MFRAFNLSSKYGRSKAEQILLTYQTFAISVKVPTPYTTQPPCHSCVARLGVHETLRSRTQKVILKWSSDAIKCTVKTVTKKISEQNPKVICTTTNHEKEACKFLKESSKNVGGVTNTRYILKWSSDAEKMT